MKNPIVSVRRLSMQKAAPMYGVCAPPITGGKKGKGSPYSITERRVPELIPLLGSQPAGDVNHKPNGRLPLLSARPAVTPLRGLLPILLLGEQRHNGCEQFAQDCYPTASRLRFEPGPFCARVQHVNHSATKPPHLRVKEEY